jgi:hypothetical protein
MEKKFMKCDVSTFGIMRCFENIQLLWLLRKRVDADCVVQNHHNPATINESNKAPRNKTPFANEKVGLVTI